MRGHTWGLPALSLVCFKGVGCCLWKPLALSWPKGKWTVRACEAMALFFWAALLSFTSGDTCVLITRGRGEVRGQGRGVECPAFDIAEQGGEGFNTALAKFLVL